MPTNAPLSPIQYDVPPGAESPAPRNCVRRYPAVGHNACRIVGYDGNGYPWIEVTVLIAYDGRESLERLIDRESRHWPTDSRPLLPPPVRLVP